MLLKITESCTMGCKHCLSDCVPDESTHMTDEVFDDSLDFILKSFERLIGHGGIIIVSGGEPMEHPKFYELMHRMMNEFLENKIQFDMFIPPVIVIATNGEIILKDIDRFITEKKRLDFEYSLSCKYPARILWQITNIFGLYPREFKDNKSINKLKNLSGIFFEKETSNGWIYPQGRALQNGLEYKTKGPKCFNIRSMSKNMHVINSYDELMHVLTFSMMSCVPCIEYNGDIKVGESKLCPTCSNIYKSKDEIFEDIRNFSCRNCKEAFEALSPEHRRAIE